MKHIGILNLPRDGNYGGMLQAVALHSFLNEKGYRVTSIGNDGPQGRRLNPALKKVIVTLLERVPGQNFNGIRERYEKTSRHEKFLSEYIVRQTRKACSEAEFRRAASREKFDAVIVGSDQVWRWDYISYDPSRYFLSFVDSMHTRKIAYAASFGMDHWQAPDMIEEIKPLLADFHAVSTREQSGVPICEALGRTDCRHVLDPTLLVDASLYDRITVPQSKEVSGTKRMLTYILDRAKDKSQLVGDAREMLGKHYVLRELGLQSDASVSEWVSEFKHADFIVTDSFHGTVFAIIFRKNFIALGNSGRGLSRFTSLLGGFNLESRLLLNEYDDKSRLQELIGTAVDYSTVDDVLPKLQSDSADFLLGAIEE
ncbi:wfaX domain protein [Parazoarcus communis]|uniref:WfaX domain protein n=1 Tax=Parazoarcus communis TaxID=41977 RepID=A0A2U8GQI0_9RHOO|nr:polysaccharide pyruvyl transferase family protein [Parazoarcus communis]AWI75266.1 wfaX domain protein [Parazoarcus communis]